MNKNNELIEEITNVVNNFIAEVDAKLIYGDNNWTKELKERIGNIAFNEPWMYEVATAGFPKYFESEWLFDMTWYKENSQKQLCELRLILESEWSKNYFFIKYDFEKLLVCKCPLKVMICQWKKSDINNLFEKFASSIEAFGNSSNETYFFVILDSDSEREFIFKRLDF